MTNNQSRFGYRLNFKDVNERLSPSFESLAKWLCPGGSIRGFEYVALNPTRKDGSKGSFSINVKTGKWADFASGDCGGDIISYCAYVRGMSQLEAAQFLLAAKERKGS